MKLCLRCEKELDSNRKKFCSPSCKYWYNSIKKDKECHLPPLTKRNRNFFSMITGYSNSLARKNRFGNRAGKRAGGMVYGSMAAIVNITDEIWAEVTYENLKTHFTSIPFYRPSYIQLGDNTTIKEEDIEAQLGIKIDF